jgi:nitrogen fixation/metabolism regulation signal transduction histidine kinase
VPDERAPAKVHDPPESQPAGQPPGLADRALRFAFSWILPGKTERRLALVVLLTAIVPLAVALYLVASLFRGASSIWFNPEIGEQLDRGVEVYKDYVRAVKEDMRHQAMAIASDEVLREAAHKGNTELIEAELDALFPRFPSLVSLAVETEAGGILARRDRGRPVDERTERSLEVRRPLEERDGSPVLVATFASERRRLDELESAGPVVTRYHQLELSRERLYQGYLNAFAALLGITVLVTIVLGIVLARGVTRRINRLSAALDRVAAGDLSVRVPVTGSDELTVLARTFNRMLGDMAHSRARIEYLQRVEAWQEMAQRLAHEIKNPLTPIQLAVQECHRKYPGGDPPYKKLLDTTLEVVEDEVGTLRRLVGNFSNFARLPHVELEGASLREFLRECRDTMGHLEDPSLGETSPDAEPLPTANVDISWRIPEGAIPAAIDRQMLRRVLVNLVRNAVQAIRDRRLGRGSSPSEVLGRVVVSAEDGPGGARILVEDDGPGIPEETRGRVFDPYFTTKTDGTGLGLAIVKKIVVEHGGEIEVGRSESLGGARFVVHLPAVRPKGV